MNWLRWVSLFDVICGVLLNGYPLGLVKYKPSVNPRGGFNASSPSVLGVLGLLQMGLHIYVKSQQCHECI